MAKDAVFLQQKGASAMGINVFSTPRDRHMDLIETLGLIADTADRNGLPKNIGSAFHRALHAPIVVNYVQYTHPSGGAVLTSLAKPLVHRTHEICTAHEFRWYDMVEVLTSEGSSDSFPIVEAAGFIGVVGVYVVDPAARPALLKALAAYADTVRSAGGFTAMAILRGHKPQHAASYERWESERAYERASANSAVRAALEQVRAIASEALIHPYDIVRVNRHKGRAN